MNHSIYYTQVCHDSFPKKRSSLMQLLFQGAPLESSKTKNYLAIIFKQHNIIVSNQQQTSIVSKQQLKTYFCNFFFLTPPKNAETLKDVDNN